MDTAATSGIRGFALLGTKQSVYTGLSSALIKNGKRLLSMTCYLRAFLDGKNSTEGYVNMYSTCHLQPLRFRRYPSMGGQHALDAMAHTKEHRFLAVPAPTESALVFCVRFIYQSIRLSACQSILMDPLLTTRRCAAGNGVVLGLKMYTKKTPGTKIDRS